MLRIILFMLLQFVASEINNINLLKQLYETNLKSSIQLDGQDRDLMNSWTVDFQVKRVNIATKYRLQMTSHMEHNFKTNEDNSKWTECVFLHRKRIRKAEKKYYEDENECLTTTSAADKEKTKAVEQLEKECRKWRKGYRYLVNTCNIENPGDEEAAKLCLVQYMEKDNFSKVIQRLIMFKLEAMGRLYLQLNNSVKDLDECLNTHLSSYLDKVRSIMDTLYQCYSLTAQTENEEKII